MKKYNRPTSLPGMALYAARLYAKRRPWAVGLIIAAIFTFALSAAAMIAGPCSSACPATATQAQEAPAASTDDSPCARWRAGTEAVE